VTTVEATLASSLPAAGPRGRSVGWWGVLCMIMTEAMLFVGLLASYFFLWASSEEWPQGAIERPEVARISVFTVVLLGSSIPIFIGESANRRGRMNLARGALFVSFLMGAVFLANQVLEYRDLHFGWRDNAYASIFYVTTGLHGLHVLLGLLINLVVQAKGYARRLAPSHDITVEVFSLYWHFVDVVWIFVFSSLYLAPHFS
jgi:heme/copper-type cytochrome/quinol oxidase subunit 3